MSVKKINAVIRAEYPEHAIEFVKGAGYFYFVSDLYIDPVYVCHLNQLPLSQWLDRVRAHIDDALAA